MEEIMREKARIARRMKPFALGRQRYAELISAVREEVRKVRGDVVDMCLKLYRSATTAGRRPRPALLPASRQGASAAVRLDYVPSPDNGGRRITVLADSAHNPASSTTLASYISHPLSIASANTHTSNPHRTTHLNYILVLCHSSPKTPLWTLSHVLTLSTPLSSSSSSSMPIFDPPLTCRVHIVLECTDASDFFKIEQRRIALALARFVFVPPR
ncbi:uncharacterized protein STEHIDRAFT_157363 [Stereum hirsutum FP-91666 SS1]|uniref:uncharacterized protein n=1 Tax=Stereum hirsutum (strain FP-91666) TaxID=721885 RepID=UPI000444921D|nr:uncharacterized protein STEHIDRAFT_157363 [Stereum hirsutum FP-91666 SS1]EIM85826.1 hypothetical protein STEHIDRAFT_157363 [Stereum hirsutum FP-91666 SS1]